GGGRSRGLIRRRTPGRSARQSPNAARPSKTPVAVWAKSCTTVRPRTPATLMPSNGSIRERMESPGKNWRNLAKGTKPWPDRFRSRHPIRETAIVGMRKTRGRHKGGSMDQRVTVDCVANARALAPALAAAGARIEDGRELPPDGVDALHQARLFRMLVPRSYGGDEVSPIAFMAAVEELAKADASTAWCVAQTSVCSTISASLPPNIAAEIFKNDPRGVLAWGPSTSKNAKAIADGGGFRVTGEWPFASGSRHATWFAAHSFVYESDGSLLHDAAGQAVQKTFVVPRRCAAIKDVWHVIGLKGTGSDTYTLTDVFVPADCAIAHHALDPAERREHGPLYSFNIYQLFGSAFPAIALGIARAMLDAFIALAQTKTPAVGKTVLRDNPVIQSQVGVAESQLAAA